MRLARNVGERKVYRIIPNSNDKKLHKMTDHIEICSSKMLSCDIWGDLWEIDIFQGIY